VVVVAIRLRVSQLQDLSQIESDSKEQDPPKVIDSAPLRYLLLHRYPESSQDFRVLDLKLVAVMESLVGVLFSSHFHRQQVS
jgi:hypothetical protein